MKTPSQKMNVSQPAYIWLSQVRASMIAANGGRGVTWPEVWDHVRAVYESRAVMTCEEAHPGQDVNCIPPGHPRVVSP